MKEKEIFSIQDVKNLIYKYLKKRINKNIVLNDVDVELFKLIKN